MAKRSRQPKLPAGSSTLIERRLPKSSRNAGKNVKLNAALMQVTEALAKGDIPQALKVQHKIATTLADESQRRSPQSYGGPDYEQIKRLLRKSDNVPIAEPSPVRQPSGDLETKAAKIKRLLEQCAELAGDDQSLLDFVLAQPFLKHAAGPPKLFEPKRSKSAEVGDNPAARVKAILDELLRLKSVYPRVANVIEKHKLAEDFRTGTAQKNYDLIGTVFELPIAPPKRWPGKGKSSEGGLIQFAENTYRDWLDNPYFSLSYLRDLDRPLYQSLYTWRSEHKRGEIPETLTRLFSDGRSRAALLADAEILSRGINNLDDIRQLVPDRKLADRLYQHFRRHAPYLKTLVTTLRP